MINSKTERKAIHAAAQVFVESNWFFHERPGSDFGIDAYAETGEKNRPNGKHIALQIKGGEKNFKRGKAGLVYYFNTQHRQYWLKVNIPILLILYDPKTNHLYWQHLTEENIQPTPKHWKIEIPFSQKLDSAALIIISNIIENFNITDNNRTDHVFEDEEKIIKESNNVKTLTISYFLEGKQLYLQMSELTDENINLNYIPSNKNWDKQKKELTNEDPYCYALSGLEKYLINKYNHLKSKTSNDILKELKNEIENLIAREGIVEISKKIFDTENTKKGIPAYDKFIEAFENHKKLKRGEYTAQIIGTIIHFKVGKKIYEIDSYEGKIAELKSFIENRSYDEIYIMTNENIWSEIYLDAGIEKEKFVPSLLNEWDLYWDELYFRIKEEIGKTDHLDQIKAKSWRSLQIFIQLYNDTSDIIKLAWELDDNRLYPMAVITMMNIFNPEVCYLEYCEFEFFASSEWENISTNEKDENTPMLFIRMAEK